MSIQDIRDARRALDSTGRVGLGPQAGIYLICGPWKEEAKEAEEGEKVSTANISSAKLLRYNAEDCVRTAQIRSHHIRELYKEDPADSPRRVRLYEQQMRLAQVASEMSYRGFPVHEKRRRALARKLTAIAKERTRELAAALKPFVKVRLGEKLPPGPYFRISPRGGVNENDLRALLFKQSARKGLHSFEYEVPWNDHSWTESGLPSVAKDALLVLWAEVSPPPELQNILRLAWQVDAPLKANSTFVSSRKLLDRIGPDGILHANINSCGAETGRWSSGGSDENDRSGAGSFNLFNLPEAKSLEDADLRGVLPNMRDFFWAGDRDHVIAHRDWSGIELEMIAEVSGDVLLRRMLDQRQHDVHSLTVIEWFGMPMPALAPGEKLKSKVPGGVRRSAKVVRFSSNYHASVATVYLKVLEVDQNAKWENIRDLHALFVEKHPGITGGHAASGGWWQRSVEQAESLGYNDTALMERRRYYPCDEKIKPTEPPNYRVQGTAADIANITMVGYDRKDGEKHGLYYRLKREFPDAYLAMHTYDSFDVICKKKDAKGVDDLMNECMSREHTVGTSPRSFPSDGGGGVFWSEV